MTNENTLLKNPTLEDLVESEWLSVRAINVCMSAELNTLEDILRHYALNKTFKNITNCGSKTNKELISICIKYDKENAKAVLEPDEFARNAFKIFNFTVSIDSSRIPNDSLLNDFSIAPLNQKALVTACLVGLLSKISSRTLNCLKRAQAENQGNSLFEILFSGLDIGNIKNAGKKTVEEIDKIKYELIKQFYLIRESATENVDADFESIKKYINGEDSNHKASSALQNLSPIKLESLSRHVKYLISNLSGRVATRLNSSKETVDKNTFELINDLLLNKLNLSDEKQFGAISISELDFLKREIVYFIQRAERLSDAEINKEYPKYLLNTCLRNRDVDQWLQIESIIDDSGRIMVFKLVGLMMSTRSLTKENYIKAFEAFYTNGKYQKATLAAIGEGIKLTRERVRQLKIKLEAKLRKNTEFISGFNINDWVNYNLNSDDDFIKVDQNLIEKINSHEGLNFNLEFYTIVFEDLFKRTHLPFRPNRETQVKIGSVLKNSEKNTYLISKRILEGFGLNEYFDDINSFIHDRKRENYSLHFKGHLLGFIIQADKVKIDEIADVCERLLLDEFDLIISSDGYLTFETHNEPSIHAYLVEVFNETGTWQSVSNLYRLLSDKHPGLLFSETLIRGVLMRNKLTFIHRGRKSTYGLKKWEDERVDIKGGAIRDIVEEVLQKANSPKHISEIMKTVLSYRPETNEKNVLSNLRQESNNRFVFYESGFIGLKNNPSTAEFEGYRRTVGSHFRDSVFRKMIGWTKDEIVEYFVKKLNYKLQQIEYILDKKQLAGDITFNEKNELVYG